MRGRGAASITGVVVLAALVWLLQRAGEAERAVGGRDTAGGRSLASGGGLDSGREPRAPRSLGNAELSTPGTTRRIGSWNIEWLGSPSKRSGVGTGIAQAPEDLAAYVAFSGVSLLCLQEIVATRDAAEGPRNDALDAVEAELEVRTGRDWRYELFEGRNPDDQLLGVLWDTGAWSPVERESWGVRITGGRSVSGSVLWARRPRAMKFSAGERLTDLVVVAVHMKADFDGDFAEHRREEAEALARALPEARKAMHDDDLVVMGDTNCTGKNERAITALRSAGLFDPNTKGERTHWRGGAMDKTLVPADQPEFAGHRFEVMSDRYLEARRWSPEEFKRRLSDHYMVVTEVRVMRDDD